MGAKMLLQYHPKDLTKLSNSAQVSSALIINYQPFFSDLIAYLKEATSS